MMLTPKKLKNRNFFLKIEYFLANVSKFLPFYQNISSHEPYMVSKVVAIDSAWKITIVRYTSSHIKHETGQRKIYFKVSSHFTVFTQFGSQAFEMELRDCIAIKVESFMDRSIMKRYCRTSLTGWEWKITKKYEIIAENSQKIGKNYQNFQNFGHLSKYLLTWTVYGLKSCCNRFSMKNYLSKVHF